MRCDRYKKENENEIDLSNIPDKTEKNFFVKLADWVKSWKLWVKIIVPIALTVVLGAGIALAAAYNYAKNLVDIMQVTPTTSTDAATDTDVMEEYDLSLKPVDGYINLLLLGVDTRNMERIQGSRSDMIIIASINTKTYDVTLTSVYRDTYLKLGSTPTYDKITHACVYGGPEMTMKSLNQALDIDIEKYAVVNFRAVAELVDAVGGIEIDVQQNEIYQLNKYTSATARNIGKKKYQLVKKPGVQTLEGVQAVSYGRIRKGVGDDYKRTERMRTVITKVFEKVKKMKLSEIKALIELMVPQCKTNLSLNDILALGFKAPKYNISSGSGFPYTVAGGYLGKISYVFPRDLASSVIQFHRDVFGQEDYRLSSEAAYIAREIAARRANATSGPPKKKDKKKDKKEVTSTDTIVATPTDENNGKTPTDTPEAEAADPGTADPAVPEGSTGETGTEPPATGDGTGDTGTVTPDPSASTPPETPEVPTP